MKKGFFYLAALGLLACGTEEPNVEVNNGDQSSIVENTNPQTGTSGQSDQEHFPGDGHDHGTGEAASIEYMEEKFDFGTVFFPSDNKHTFKFKNTGSVPLTITDATASCGCTVPSVPEEPIAPGAIGELDVIFRPKDSQVGQTVTKKITVTANTVPAETYLEITAKVVEAM
jgi:hypothetical protein